MSDKEEVQVITATSSETEDTPSIGTEEFIKSLLTEFNSKNVWRRLESVAQSLHVDPGQLKQWLDTTPGFMRKSGKEDGVFYYCFEERYNREVKKHQKEQQKEKKQKPAIREEDRYAQAMLHMVYWNFWKVLKTYGLEISQRDKEAFNFLAVALDKLESGMVLLSNKNETSMEKLPTFK